jgi:hypothetical protein
MNRHRFTPRSRLGAELEQALADWIAASRRAYHPERELRDEMDEHEAWSRVQSVLSKLEPAAAAA